MKRPRIYLAGPYTKPDPSINTHKALQMGNFLWDRGFAPFIPHLSHFWHTMTPRSYEMWVEYDNQFLPCCDALFRMPGESPGSEREIELARSLGIPVFHKVQDLLDAYPDRPRDDA